MKITYVIDGHFYDYEIDYEDYLKALTKILDENSKEELIQLILDFDNCSVDLSESYADELESYFREEAEKRYMEVRCEI